MHSNSVNISQSRAEQFERHVQDLRLITDALPALVSYVDAECRYRFVNGRYVEWFGQTPEQIIGRHLREVLGDTAFERVRPHVERVLGGQRVWYEATLPYRHGGTRLVSGEYVPDIAADGTVLGYYSLVTDVTERKQAETARARLAAIVETSGDAIMSIGLDGRIQTWNGGAERLFGYSAEEAIGCSIDLILPIEHADGERSIVDPARRGELVGPFEAVRRTKDGRMIDVSVTVSPIRDSCGRVIGISKVDRDISELKLAERRKDEFLATLGHELRNPLAAVRSATELLTRNASDSRELFEQMTGLIQRQVGLMVRLIDDLLDISRISHGTLSLRNERVSLISLVDQAVDAARPMLEHAQHRLDRQPVDTSEDRIEVDGDAVRLIQVFTNVLSNACKYTDPGGRIHIGVARSGDDAVIEIRDTGVGIPGDKLDAIFEMFSQLDSPRRGQDGLGIGLSLSRRLIELHGGTMSAASDGLGCGTTITIRLPALPAAAPRVTPPPPAERQLANEAGSARRVLIVDDNTDAAASLALLLSALGHVTRTANDGAGALAEAAAFGPDVILLDLGLPDIHGVDVCKAMRAQPWGRSMMVVALSGWGQDRDKRQTAEAGFDAHLTKPAALADLTRLLASGR